MRRQAKRERRSWFSSASFLKKLHESDGEFILSDALTAFFVMLLVVFFVAVLGVVNTSMKLHSVAADLSRYIEIRGMVDAAVYTELDRLANVAGVAIETRDITGTFSGTKLQFGADFTVSLSTTGRIGVGGILSVPVHLETQVTGRSERYWK